MSRLIDADKIDFNEVFVGASEIAQGTRNAAQMLIDKQPTAFDVDKVVEQLEKLADEANDKILEDGGLQLYYDGYEDAMRTAIEIVKGGGVDGN